MVLLVVQRTCEQRLTLSPEEVSEQGGASSNACDQGFSNSRHQIIQETNFCNVVPDICGSLVWNCFPVTLILVRILKWLLDF